MRLLAWTYGLTFGSLGAFFGAWERAGRRQRLMIVHLWTWGLLVVFLAAWEAACRITGIPQLILPAPSAVLATLWEAAVGTGNAADASRWRTEAEAAAPAEWMLKSTRDQIARLEQLLGATAAVLV